VSSSTNPWCFWAIKRDSESKGCAPQQIRAAEFPAQLADADPMEERPTHAPISVAA
jgi:hypothetical protein